ncbi:MAG TPA: prenyltransferase/squalene oxidase repeat-containing protein, partial [Planctomycetota bacterium]|nr:prenyltransferase/squalene oxidase repeat-containing protein [Planctomycetota bacterium]
GRLVYGRSQADQTTDLVVWDPARPTVPPEPAYGLNTEHNELAPALGPDGRFYFASDRPDGLGGYDLYVAPWGETGFGKPAPLTACNTALDESDPAPSDNGLDFVFVRIDRAVDHGNSGVMHRWRLGDPFDPVPVFAAAGARRNPQPIDRDPAFAPGGAALWFVRKGRNEPLRLMRASLCAGVFDEALLVGETWGTGELRAPLPQPDGVHLGLLQPRRGETATDLWFVATATEVYPWWPGQSWLEWILIGIISTCALLLLLLHFGRRWSTLDLLAQCLLLSLLLHILVLLWLMGVEIGGTLMHDSDEGSGMQVSVITAAEAAGTTAGGMQAFDPAAQVQFATEERALDAAAPATAAERATAAELAGPEAQWASAAAPRDVAAETRVQDAAAAATQRTGQDQTATPAEASLQSVERSATAASAAQAARRAGAAAEAVEVVVPGGVMARASQSTASLAPAGSLEALPSPSARAAETPAPALHDAGTAAAAAAPAPRAGRDVAAGAALAAEATQAVEPAAATGSHAARATADAGSVPSASAPAAAVDRPGHTALDAPAPEAGSALAPSKARAVAVPVALREGPAEASAPAAARREAGAAPAAPLTAVAATLEGPRAAAAEATSRSTDTNGSSAAPAPAAAAPSSQLSRGGASPAAPLSPPAEAPPAAASPQRLKAVPLALRDGAAAEPARPKAAGTASTASTAGKAGKTAAPVASALDVGVQGPRAPAVDRPARGTTSAASSSAVAIGVSPPSSLLERTVQSAPRGPQEIAAAPASAYSNRFGPAKAKAIEQFGGSVDTERAVSNGLRYLAKIQKSDGFWGERDAFDDKYGQLYVGKTALCVLAFLGAGHTPTSNSEHSKVVAKALDQLLALQDEDTGAFGMSSSYGHGISTYAIAECYGLTKDPRLRRSLESALTWIIENQGPRRDKRNRGGWGYFSPGLRPEDDYARVSVTSWMVMALESARISGVDLPPEVLPRAREYLEQSFDQPNGWFRYNHKPSRLQSAWPTLPASTPAGAFSLMLLGAPAGDRMVQAAVAYTVERRPEAYRRYDDDDFVLRGQGNVYFWYYGTLCTFLAGGEAWERWNERLREMLPAAQAADGSFPPIDVYAREAGDTKTDRSYSTAMCVLSLEIYYRYFTPLLLGR